MSADHYEYRDDPCGWAPFKADGQLSGIGYQSTLGADGFAHRRQPIGFRGANPGQSLDDRGLPRVRVKAICST